MNDLAPAPAPLSIDQIQTSRSDGGEVELRLSGRWLDPAPSPSAEQPLLVIQLDGRRHRFPATAEAADDADDALDAPGEWRASFTIPAWAEPVHDGQAALWVGDAVVPVPVPGERSAVPSSPPSDPPPEAALESLAEPDPRSPASPESARSGPLADLLLRETVTALHAELEQRTADAAQMRGALAHSQSDLEMRVARQAQLEATLAELRGELERLTGAVEDQREELKLTRSERAPADDDRASEVKALREQLAAANVAREAAITEMNGLRAELERLGSELTATRERVGSESGGLGEANRLLADARALADELKAQRTGG
jgi:hypothetical protein